MPGLRSVACALWLAVASLRAADEARAARAFATDQGARFASLGLGTIWFGQRWPPGNARYAAPTRAEVDAFLARGVAGLLGDEAPARGGADRPQQS